jgi:hypothetical protein
VLPVLQEAEEELKEERLPPLTLEANRETFFLTCLLPHEGQITSSMVPALRTSSSNGLPHPLHTNSKIGISHS